MKSRETEGDNLNTFLKRNRLQAALFILLFVAVVGVATRQLIGVKEKANKAVVQRRLNDNPPLDGIMENDTGGKVPGNPARTLADAKKLAQFISKYRERHAGESPPTIRELNNDYVMNWAEYGIQDPFNVADLFVNPDAKFSDNPGFRSSKRVVPFVVTNERPDGTLVGSPRQPGERDVVATTDLYYHENIRHFSKRDTINPVGFFIVVYDDGEVAQIPWQKVRMAPSKRGPNATGNTMYGFPNQAGVDPKSPTLEERFRNHPRS